MDITGDFFLIVFEHFCGAFFWRLQLVRGSPHATLHTEERLGKIEQQLNQSVLQ